MLNRATSVHLLLLVLLSAPGLHAQRPELTSFANAFASAEPPPDAASANTRLGILESRETALAGLEGLDGESTALALLDAMRQIAAEVRALESERQEQLLGQGKAQKQMQARIALDRLNALGDALTERAGEIRDAAGLQALLEAALADDRLPFAARLSIAARAGEHPEAPLKFLRSVLKKPRNSDRVLVALTAARALGTRASDLEDETLRLLKHKQALVREQAAFTLAALAQAGSVKPLIELLEDEEGKTRERIGRALEILTRQPLGSSHRSWDAWWAENGRDVRDGKVTLGGGEVSEVADEDAGTYYSIPMSGEAIVYVLDVSKSMNRALADGSKAAEGEEVSRWDRARRELVRALGELPPRKTFNIVTFGKGTYSFADEMTPASPKNVRRAQAWVMELEMTLGTCLYDALDLAFVRAGRPAGGGFFDSSMDTIFVLTDGRPMVPKLDKNVLVGDKAEAITAAVRRWNLLERVTVHAIGLGTPLPKKLLEQLAGENGGQFVHEK